MKLSFTRKTKTVIVLLLLVAIALLIWWWLSRGIVTENRYAIESQELVGKNTGYHLEIELDRLPLNPYPGSKVDGRVWVADQRNRPVRDVSGGVWLYINGAQTGLSAKNLGRDEVLVGTELVSSFVANYGLQGPAPGQWKVAEDGSNQYTFASTDPINVPNARFAYLELEDGSADFSFANVAQTQLMNGKSINIVAATLEQPLYRPADEQYLDGRRIAKNFDGSINTGEPSSVRQQRESDILSYQLIPLERIFQLNQDPSLLPANEEEANEADNQTTLIQTTITVPFGEFADFGVPVTPEIINSTTDYYYQITSKPTRLTERGQKFAITIKPVAKAGKSLPANIGNVIRLGIAPQYPVIANDYPAGFAEANRANLQDNFMSFTGRRPAGGSTINSEITFIAGAAPVELEVELTGRENLFGFVAFDAKVFDQVAYEELQRVHNGRAPQAEILKLTTMRLVQGVEAPIIKREIKPES